MHPFCVILFTNFFLTWKLSEFPINFKNLARVGVSLCWFADNVVALSLYRQHPQQSASFPAACSAELRDANDVMDPTHPSSVGPNSSDEDLYNHGISFDTALPIAKYRQHIVETIRKSDTVVVHGATGCGKTTQIPVYILDDCIRRGQMPYIIVTQPRRIAAVSIAQHVCQERHWSLGGPVGYQIAQDVQVTDRTRIVYCTLGVFLQQLIHTGWWFS